VSAHRLGRGMPADSLAEVTDETNKDGSGKGQWSAWKVSGIACFAGLFRAESYLYARTCWRWACVLGSSASFFCGLFTPTSV